MYLLLLQPELLAIMRKMYDVCPKGCPVKFGAGLVLIEHEGDKGNCKLKYFSRVQVEGD